MSNPAPRVADSERARRWRLVLGGVPDEQGRGEAGLASLPLRGPDVRVDAALGALYDLAAQSRRRGSRSGGLGTSAPAVVRWLGDVRRCFPSPVVQVMQRDAIERLDLRQLLLEPEMLGAVEPDLHLATMIVELSRVLPDTTRASARQVVRRVVEHLEQRVASRTRQAVGGALARAHRTRRPRPSDIDWHRTIRANLQHYLPDTGTIVPERLVGHGRRQRSLARDVVVAIDQSGSMADSVVHAAVFGSVLASMPALSTRLVAFDTSVVDLTPLLHDPVDVLFGVQLGGGTDIASAMAYCAQCITRPSDTLLVLVSDLFEGGNGDLLSERVAALVRSGVTVLVLLALSDDGAPAYDHARAAEFAALGVPSMACTPDMFPDLLAAALEGHDLARWANERGMHTAAPPP
jgi:Mg-chelatase subunit ChlD